MKYSEAFKKAINRERCTRHWAECRLLTLCLGKKKKKKKGRYISVCVYRPRMVSRNTYFKLGKVNPGH